MPVAEPTQNTASKESSGSSAPPLNSRRQHLTPRGRDLGLMQELPAGSGQCSVCFVAKKAGKVQLLKGNLSAARVRKLAHDFEHRRQTALLRAEARAKRSKRGASKQPSFRPKKKIEGEQKPKMPPTIGLHPKYGKAIRKSFSLIASVLDGIAWLLRNVQAKSRMAPTIICFGFVLIAIALPVWHMLDVAYTRATFVNADLLAPLVKFVRWAAPTFFVATSVLCFVGGYRMLRERPYRSLLRDYIHPEPAWENAPVFFIGEIRKVLRDLWEGTIAFGGVGSGKTVGFISPILIQLMRKLNNPDPSRLDARFGGLLLDVKGNFTDLVIYLMLVCGRPLSDLVLLDPDLDMYRYNPLDPEDTRFAERAANKLVRLNKLQGNESKGENVYWDLTSQNVVRTILKVLSIVKPRSRIGLDDVWRFTRDDDRVAVLMRDAKRHLESRKRNGQITADSYTEYTDAVSELQTNWHKLTPHTKGILKTTITNLIGTVAVDPKLQRVFCRDTNFSMKDTINAGKVVVFRGRSLDPRTARTVAVCLKLDFQEWAKRRTGSTAADFGLNTSRSLVFMADEFQEVVTCGGEGDESFFQLARESKVISIVATQNRSSLAVAIKDEEQLKALLGSLTTKAFLKLSDKDTQELGAFYSGETLIERAEGQVSTGSVIGAMAGGYNSSQQSPHLNVRHHWEKVYRPEDFGRLVTISRDKAPPPGPYYSEAIIYNYSETDPSLKSFCRKTKLYHLYPDQKEMTSVSLHFDDLLYARNSQARCMRMFLYLAAAGDAEQRQQHLAASERLRELQGRKESMVEVRITSSGLKGLIEQAQQFDVREEKLIADIKVLTEQRDAYKAKHGLYGPELAPMEQELRDKQTSLANVRVQRAMASGAGCLLAPEAPITADLLKGREAPALKAALEKAKHLPVMPEGSSKNLAEQGVGYGLSVLPHVPNHVAAQQSVLKTEPAAQPAAVPPATDNTPTPAAYSPSTGTVAEVPNDAVAPLPNEVIDEIARRQAEGSDAQQEDAASAAPSPTSGPTDADTTPQKPSVEPPQFSNLDDVLRGIAEQVDRAGDSDRDIYGYKRAVARVDKRYNEAVQEQHDAEGTAPPAAPSPETAAPKSSVEASGSKESPGADMFKMPSDDIFGDP